MHHWVSPAVDMSLWETSKGHQLLQNIVDTIIIYDNDNCSRSKWYGAVGNHTNSVHSWVILKIQLRFLIIQEIRIVVISPGWKWTSLCISGAQKWSVLPLCWSHSRPSDESRYGSSRKQCDGGGGLQTLHRSRLYSYKGKSESGCLNTELLST